MTDANFTLQGKNFAQMTTAFHGGRYKQAGGSVSYPDSFDTNLPTDLHNAASVSSIDTAFAELPQFAGKYGMEGGARKSTVATLRAKANKHRNTRKLTGGGSAFNYLPGSATADNYMILTDSEPAHLNQQWYDENLVNPHFQGPASQFIAQKAGAKKTKKAKKAKKVKKAKKAKKITKRR